MTVKAVKAKKVREEDFLPGLDNGYVVETERAGYGGGMIRLTFHTAEGEEAYLECPDDMPVTIDRRSD